MFKRLVITNGNFYITDDGDDYVYTQDVNEAKNFRWYWLIAPKKIFLEGIKKRFGNDFKYEYVGGR